MTINQVSIFVENSFGKLSKIFAVLSDANVRILATTIADTLDYGILRLIVSDPQYAYKVLRDADIIVNMTPVYAFKVEDAATSISSIMTSFTAEGVSVEYLYCFASHNESMLVMRTNNDASTCKAIRENRLAVIAESDLLLM